MKVQEVATSTEAAPITNDGLATPQTPATPATGAEGEGQQQQPAEGQPAAIVEGNPPGDTPEAYEFAAPEGQAFDSKVIESFSEVAKELKLPQGDAQKLLDKMGPVLAARQTEAVQAARAEWETATRNDPEFGGAKLDENLAIAKKAFTAFGSDSLRTLLNESGLGNHPEVIRFMYKAGKAIGEDGFVPSGRTSANTNDPAKRLFPNMN